MDPNQEQDLSYQDKVKVLSELTKSASYLQYNPQSAKWEKMSGVSAPEPSPLKAVTTLSFNVLFDRLGMAGGRGSMEHVRNSRQRFASTLTRINQLQLDIIGLQEVTPVFFEMLLSCKWSREYKISDFSQNQRGFGNVVMTKLPAVCFQSIKVNRLPRAVEVVFIPLLNKGSKQVEIISFSSVHLIALAQNHQARVEQFTDLLSKLRKFDKLVSGVVLQGDMNFHSQAQTPLALNNGFKDSWLQKHALSDSPGFTFDSSRNALINQMYWGFERRQMRLDRIFYRGSTLRVREISIVMDKPIYPSKQEKVSHYWKIKGGLLFAADYLGLDLHRQKQSFLYPSDHFGLLAQLALVEE